MSRHASRKPSGRSASSRIATATATRTASEAGEPRARRGDLEAENAARARRRASRFLWSACETLLAASAEPRALNRALDMLARAFRCDGVALHVIGPSGALEPWSARGAWRTLAGDLRDCISVPLHRGAERVGSLELKAAPGESWQPAQLALIKTAAGALGAALGARFELERLRREPGRDRLTGLPDAPAFRLRVEQELARARRHGPPVAIVLLDVDHLAALNARYGRPTGDAVLSEIALLLKLTLRESDLVARLEGDCFGILLPETDRDSALRCAERLRRALEEHRFPRAGRLTVSAGVAACPVHGADSLQLFTAADQALALAKKGGRRRVLAAAPGAVH